MADEKIALILDPNGPPLIVPRAEALELYKEYLNRTITNALDERLFAALTLAIGTMSKPTLAYLDGERSWAEIKIETWRNGAAA